MIVRVAPETKAKLTQLARNEGKSTSQVLRDLIDAYIRERDPEAYIDELWNRVGGALQSNGVVVGDVDRAIAEVRQRKR
jgi:predicted transcriptional regulator